jgi:uncharacterized protein YegL
MAEQEPFSSNPVSPFGNIGLASNPEPRCPCVLLLDVSGSMGEIVSGETKDLGYTVNQDGQTFRVVSGGVSKIDLLNEGLKVYKDDLSKDALASQRVEVCVITFGKSVELNTPFTIASDFEPPVLTSDGETPMADAINKAIDLIKDRKAEYRQHGLHYFRPWIFMITDGKPTDHVQLIQEACSKIKEGEKNKAFAFFAVGVEGADMEKLSEISVRSPIKLKDTSFREMFVWLSQSQKSVSQSSPGLESGVSLPSPAGWGAL